MGRKKCAVFFLKKTEGGGGGGVKSKSEHISLPTVDSRIHFGVMERMLAMVIVPMHFGRVDKVFVPWRDCVLPDP